MSHVCALYLVTNMHGRASSAQQKVITCTPCDPVADSLCKTHSSSRRGAGASGATETQVPHSARSRDCMQWIWRAALVYLFIFFNLFVGLFGIITFDPFYKTNNTLISSCISGVATWFRTFAMLCKPNSTAKPSRSVRIIANVLNACCTAANAFRNVNYLYNRNYYDRIIGLS